MSVEVAYEPKSYISDGSLSPRSIEWPFISADDLRVTVDDEPKTAGLDFQVNGVYPSAALVPLPGFAEAGQVVSYRRVTPATQGYRISSQSLSRVNLEGALDRQTLVIQEQSHQSAEARVDLDTRAIMVPKGDFAPVLAPASESRVPYRVIGRNPATGALAEIDLPEMFRGAPGGNVMAIGLFAIAATLSIPLGTDVVRTSGWATLGVGNAEYLADAAVDAAYVAANPRTAFISANGRGFRLSASDVVRPEQFGVVGDGSDELDALQAVFEFAAAARKAVHISRTHYLRPDDTRFNLYVPSNSIINFEPGGKLENLAHNRTSYVMLAVYDANDVEINNAVLDGRRDLNSAVTGEFGMGVSVRGDSANIRIRNPICDNMWGDGIYIGQLDNVRNVRDVEIWSPKANNCRRQGMSIVSAERCIVHEPEWTNTSGTLPHAGLDIEPNNDACVLKNIQILNPVTRGNTGNGILIYLRPLRGISGPINIVITNHLSENDGQSGAHCGFSCSRSGQPSDPVTGTITYTKTEIRKPGTSGVRIDEWNASGPHVLMDQVSIFDPNESGNTVAFAKAGIAIYNASESDLAAAIGNITIRNPSVVDSRAEKKIDRYFYIQNAKTAHNVAKVIIDNPQRLSGAQAVNPNRVEGDVKWSDKFEQSRLVHTNTVTPQTVLASNFAGIYSNDGATGTITYSLAATHPVGWPDITFVENAGQSMRVDPDAASAIVPGGGLGKYVEIPAFGRVTLRRRSATEWRIVDARGALVFEP